MTKQEYINIINSVKEYDNELNFLLGILHGINMIVVEDEELTKEERIKILSINFDLEYTLILEDVNKLRERVKAYE